MEPQGHDLCLWHVCTLYITTHMSTCTVGTCQICPAMSEGQSKNSNFRNKRVQYCKNALLRFQRSQNEISKRIFRFQSANPNFQVPLKTQVHSQAYNNITKPQCTLLPAVPGIWDVARGAWPDPRHGKHFSTPEKIFSKTFFDRMNSITQSGGNF